MLTAAPVCIAIAAQDPDTLFRLAQEALRDSPFLELRLDALAFPADAIAPLRQFCAGHPHVTILATCRRIAGGGGFPGAVDEQLELLARFAEAGGRLVDVELETLEELAAPGKQQAEPDSAQLAPGQPTAPGLAAAWRDRLTRAGARLLVSAHDFAATGDLAATLARLRMLARPVSVAEAPAFSSFARTTPNPGHPERSAAESAALAPADLLFPVTEEKPGPPPQSTLYKVVSTATCLADNLRMLAFLNRAAREFPTVGICMGPAGLPSRVLSLRAGAPFTFASHGEAATAPGQLPAHELLGSYRVAALTPATRIYGIAGNPVAHSLSPVMHNAAFKAAGIDAVYLPLHTTSIPDLLQVVRELPLAGLSITMPWKVEILPHLDVIDPLAARIGAVNTVLRRKDGSLYGTNTDAAAVVEPLARRIALPGARVLLLGAGGAARAAAFGLTEAGAQVFILNRTPAAARQLAEACGARVAQPDAMHGFDIIVQATPAGMAGHPAASLLPGFRALGGVQVLLEMVYLPIETPLVRTARQRGIEVVTGLEMFAHQGVQQWELWTGKEAPAAAMHEALQAALLPAQ